MPVAIITDSAASLPAELAAKWDVTVVPMWLVIEGELVRESDVHLDQVLAATDVTTSGPNPAEFNEALEQHGPDAEVVVLTIASTMSSTHQAATLAARAAGDRVRVIDTSTAAGAEGLIVLAAAEAAQQGADLDAVEAAARRVAERVRLVATVPTLDHLVRSGRVPGIAGWAGRALDISPLFEFGSGKVKKLRPAHGHDAALDRIIHLWERSLRPDVPLRVAALHAAAPDDARSVLARVAEVHPPVESFSGEFGAVMVAHTGPGLVGLAWWWDEPDQAD